MRPVRVCSDYDALAMTAAPLPFAWCQRGRIGLLWLLALLVPLQCGAALVRLAAGPAHSHGGSLADSAPALVLHDFRRGAVHDHLHDDRHHHAPDDTSVRVADSTLDRLDTRDEGSGGAVALLVPLVSAVPGWHAGGPGDASPFAAGWWMATRSSAPLERPPRGVTP